MRQQLRARAGQPSPNICGATRYNRRRNVKHGTLASAAIIVAGIMQAASLGAGAAGGQGQTRAGTTTKWASPRTAWGDPDLQGKWEVVETGTPMERPKEFGNREFLTDQELAARMANLSKSSSSSDDPDADVAFPDNKKRAPEHEKGIRGEEYNKFWVDSGPQKIKGRQPLFQALKRQTEEWMKSQGGKR
jgi:hypothetical protein